MYLLIIFLPLLGFILVLNRFVGRNGLKMSIIMMFIVTVISYTAFIETGIYNTPILIESGSWLSGTFISIPMAFEFDSLTVSMLIPIITVSLLVQLYSFGYMGADPHITRYFSYLNLFSFSMLLLVTGENLLVMFLGWEGVGVASYLLINFWFTRVYANMAALKAFLINRIGDCGLTLSFLLSLNTIGDLSMSTLFSLAHHLNSTLVFALTILFLIGAIAKSAQLGLHTWLASAMEG